MQCPGCDISYCLDCEQPVDPLVYRCAPCLDKWMATDPWRIDAIKAQRENAALKEILRYVRDNERSPRFDFDTLAEALALAVGPRDEPWPMDGQRASSMLEALRLSKGAHYDRTEVKASSSAGTSRASDEHQDATAAIRGTTPTTGSGAHSGVGPFRSLFEVTDGYVHWWVAAHGPNEAMAAVEATDGYEHEGRLQAKQLHGGDCVGSRFDFGDGETCNLWNAFELVRGSTQVFACSEW